MKVSPSRSLSYTSRVLLDMSGYFGGVESGNASTFLMAVFLDAGGEMVGQGATSPVTSAELPKPKVRLASMAFRSFSGNVPPNARTIVIQLTAKYLNYNDCQNCQTVAYADNLVLKLKQKVRK
jgi:hypothetical protein